MSTNKDYLKRKDQLIDSSKALRYSYNADEKGLDIINHGSPLIPKKYDRMVITNTDHCITSISYYADNIVQETKITFAVDIAGHLAGTYFSFYSGLDKQEFVVWYKVSGVGSAPSIPGAILIEVDILNNDLAPVIALATHNSLITLQNAKFYFNADYCTGSSRIDIKNKQGGITTTTTDNGTGFVFESLQDGSSELVGIMDITYNDGDVTNVVGYSEVLRD